MACIGCVYIFNQIKKKKNYEPLCCHNQWLKRGKDLVTRYNINPTKHSQIN